MTLPLWGLAWASVVYPRAQQPAHDPALSLGPLLKPYPLPIWGPWAPILIFPLDWNCCYPAGVGEACTDWARGKGSRRGIWPHSPLKDWTLGPLSHCFLFIVPKTVVVWWRGDSPYPRALGGGGGRWGRWPCSSSLYPPVKSFLTCLPERLQGLGPLTRPSEAWWGKGLGKGMPDDLWCGYIPSGEVMAVDGAWACRSSGAKASCTESWPVFAFSRVNRL